MFESISEMPERFIKAFEYYLKSANQGKREAQFALGVMLFEGRRGVPKNKKKGIEWLNLAAKQGLREAVEYLRSHA